MHAVDPEMPVVASGLAPFERAGPGRLPWRDYLRAIVNYGAAAKIDAFAFHPYPDLEPGQAAAAEVVGLLDEVQSYLDARGAGGIPLWMTEVGVSTVGPEARTPEQQSQELVEILSALEARGTPVVIFHRLQDGELAGFPLEAGFGVVAADGVTLKPAFCAIAAARGEPCG